MLFFKETLSYKLVSLLDEAKIKRKYINILLFIINFYKFKISKKSLIKHNLSYNEKIELFIELFKERFYLEQLVRTNFIQAKSKVQYTLNNNILLSEISYDKIRFNIEYTISQDKYCIYITANKISFNASEENLKIKSISEAFETSIWLLFTDWKILINELFQKYWKDVFVNV